MGRLTMGRMIAGTLTALILLTVLAVSVGAELRLNQIVKADRRQLRVECVAFHDANLPRPTDCPKETHQ
jgi:hypothetical protein